MDTSYTHYACAFQKWRPFNKVSDFVTLIYQKVCFSDFVCFFSCAYFFTSNSLHEKLTSPTPRAASIVKAFQQGQWLCDLDYSIYTKKYVFQIFFSSGIIFHILKHSLFDLQVWQSPVGERIQEGAKDTGRLPRQRSRHSIGYPVTTRSVITSDYFILLLRSCAKINSILPLKLSTCIRNYWIFFQKWLDSRGYT